MSLLVRDGGHDRVIRVRYLIHASLSLAKLPMREFFMAVDETKEAIFCMYSYGVGSQRLLGRLPENDIPIAHGRHSRYRSVSGTHCMHNPGCCCNLGVLLGDI